MAQGTSTARKPFAVEAAWDARTLERDTSWVVRLTDAHRRELAAALEHFQGATRARGLTAQWLHGHMTPHPDDFPLPTLAPLLEGVRHDLEERYGLVLLKGFPVAEHAARDLRLLHAGLTAHVGTPRPQTVFGELIQDVHDDGQAPLKERRGSKHNRALSFHNDPCDAISFLCVSTPRSGGTSLFASSVAIHDAMLETAPEHVETLYQDFTHSYQDYLFVRTGTNDAFLPKDRSYAMPIFSEEAGRFACKYSRFYVDQAQEFPEVPRLTAAQVAALDCFEAAIANERRHLTLQYEPGDVMFLNNFVCFHARTAFTDGEGQAAKRRLLRVWLTMPNSRPLSPRWRRSVFFRRCEAGAPRGGVTIPEISYA
jgi:alpha-ketoglutarate-dependent taurine dioxygenase